MSFILDALKKSENERQQQSGAEFTAVPIGAAATPTPRWLWAIIVLLGLLVVLLLYMVLRGNSPPDRNANSAQPAALPAATAADVDTFEQQIEQARARQAERPRAAESAPQPSVTANESPPPQPVQAAAEPLKPSVDEGLPSFTTLRANGTLQLPELHLDIHVFSEVPTERFVFINMNKHKEGSSLESGPSIEEITPEGVVLQHRGTRFLLTRD